MGVYSFEWPGFRLLVLAFHISNHSSEPAREVLKKGASSENREGNVRV